MIKKAPHVTTLGIIACYLLIAACSGSPSEPSEKNFTEALNDYLQQEGITVDIGRKMPIQFELERIEPEPAAQTGEYKVPIVKQQPLKRPNSAKARCEALEQAGLMTSKETVIEREEKQYWSRPGKTVQYRVKEYDVSDSGKKLLRLPDASHRQYRLKIASAVVDSIETFSSPTPTQGYTISKVSYTFSPDQVQGWAKDADFETVFPEIKQKLQAGQKDQAVLVLMHTGWKHGQSVIQDMSPDKGVVR